MFRGSVRMCMWTVNARSSRFPIPDITRKFRDIEARVIGLLALWPSVGTCDNVSSESSKFALCRWRSRWEDLNAPALFGRLISKVQLFSEYILTLVSFLPKYQYALFQHVSRPRSSLRHRLRSQTRINNSRRHPRISNFRTLRPLLYHLS